MSTTRNILVALGAITLAVSLPQSDANAKSRKKQQLNYQAASEAATQETAESAPINSEPAGIGQSTAIKMFNSLNRQKSSLQQQANSLGSQLAMTRGSGKKKKITRQMEQVAIQIKAIDSKIEALPRSVRMGESSAEAEKAAAKEMVNSMIDERLKAMGVTNTGSFDMLDEPEPEPAPVYQNFSPVRYHVQLAAVAKPNMSAFRNISNVEQSRLPNGMYAYYQGNFNTKAEAEQACRKLRSSTAYRDAFVIATENGKRISLSQAATR